VRKNSREFFLTLLVSEDGKSGGKAGF